MSATVSHVLLNRIKAHNLHRTEQSGFTPHRSTIDHIATLNMILQTRGEYRKPSWVAYVDFRSVFALESVAVLWSIRSYRDIIIIIISTLFTDSPCGFVVTSSIQGYSREDTLFDFISMVN